MRMHYNHVLQCCEKWHRVGQLMLTLVLALVNLSVSFYLFHVILLGLITIDHSCTHALVEFVEEECTGVVPLQRITGESCEAGDKVTVLWNNGKAYPAVCLLSGNVLAFKNRRTLTITYV